MKRIKPVLKCLFAVGLLAITGQAHALRCGNKIVDIGDRKHKVAYACGQPTYIDNYDQPVPGVYHLYTHVDIWTYNFGPTRFMVELVFENGVLRRINQLGYGY